MKRNSSFILTIMIIISVLVSINTKSINAADSTDRTITTFLRHRNRYKWRPLNTGWIKN